MKGRDWLTRLRRSPRRLDSVFVDAYGISYGIERGNALDRELIRCQGQMDAAVDWCRSRIRPRDLAIDIGANAGYWTLPLAQVAERVVAFEPDPAMRAKLQSNLALNPLISAKVVVRGEAVADGSGQAALHIRRAIDGDALLNTGLSSLVSSTHLESLQTVATIALDDLAADLAGERVGFIKIDVEGAESLVFKGALKTIDTHKPLLHWEALTSPEGSAFRANCRDVLSMLDARGYNHFAVLKDASTAQVRNVDDLARLGYDVNVVSALATKVPRRLAWSGR